MKALHKCSDIRGIASSTEDFDAHLTVKKGRKISYGFVFWLKK